MHDDLWHHTSYKVPHQTNGEPETCPIVPKLHDVKTVTIEVHLAIKVHLMKSLHGDLVAAIVLLAILLAVKCKVVFNGLAREFGLLILAGCKGRVGSPEGSEDGDSSEETEEDGCLESTAYLAGYVPGNDGEEGEESYV